MDPQHRLLLEETYHCLEDAGITLEEISGTNTGVYAGVMTQDYLSMRFQQPVYSYNAYSSLNVSPSYNSARISYFYNLKGPSLTLDTLCSSSLVAMNLAVDALQQGKCDMALAAAANLVFLPENYVANSLLKSLAPDGKSKSFSDLANGYAKSEGIGVVMLKPLDAALRDGNKIHAVIKAVSVNHDGNSKPGITVPSTLGQVNLLQKVYRESNIDPTEIDYVEAHATGTLVGDPLEMNALGQFFGQARQLKNMDPLPVGSIKANIGHTEATAGIAALAKSLLIMQHNKIPPTPITGQLNSKIPFEKLNLRVVTEVESLETQKPLTIAINSFGMGGTNSHMVIQQYEAPDVNRNKNIVTSSLRILLLTARKSEMSLKSLVERIKMYIESQSLDEEQQDTFLSHLCYTYAVRRTHHNLRLAIIFSNKNDLVVKLQQAADALTSKATMPEGIIYSTTNIPAKYPAYNDQETHDRVKLHNKLCMVFSGQGPQWYAMGRDLISESAIFRASIERTDKELSKYVSWSLITQLCDSNETDKRIYDTDVAQPAIFAIQVALYDLWKYYSVTPDVIIGHSVGEVAAAYVSGAMSFEDSVKVIYERSKLQHKCASLSQGKMLAIEAGIEQITPVIELLDGKVEIAAINSPSSVVLSGDADAVTLSETTMNSLFSELTKVKKIYLRNSAAFHSFHMDPIRDELLEKLSEIKPLSTTTKLYSTVTGKVSVGATLDAQYWWKNVREKVAFAPAINQLILDSGSVPFWIENSPHPVLATSLRDTLIGDQSYHNDAVIVPSLIRKEAELCTFLTSLSTLWANGYNRIDWNVVIDRIGCETKLVPTPRYPFEQQQFWMESNEKRCFRINKPPVTWHPLLGSRVTILQSKNLEVQWRRVIDMNNEQIFGYLKDHQIKESILMPFAAYTEIIVAAIRELSTGDLPRKISSITLKDVQVKNPLVLHKSEPKFLETVVNPSTGYFCIFSSKALNDNDLVGPIGQTPLSTFSGCILHFTGFYEIESRSTTTLSDDTSPFLTTYINNLDSFKEIREDVYSRLGNIGLNYGECFRGVVDIQAQPENSCTVSLIRTPQYVEQQQNDGYIIHPAVFDIAIHSSLGLLDIKQTVVPVSVKSLKIHVPDEYSMNGTLGKDEYYSTTIYQKPMVVGLVRNAFNQSADMIIHSFDSEKKTSSIVLECKQITVQSMANIKENEITYTLGYPTWVEQSANEVATSFLPTPSELLLLSTDHSGQTNNVSQVNDIGDRLIIRALDRIGMNVDSGMNISKLQLLERVHPTRHEQALLCLDLLKQSKYVIVSNDEITTTEYNKELISEKILVNDIIQLTKQSSLDKPVLVLLKELLDLDQSLLGNTSYEERVPHLRQIIARVHESCSAYLPNLLNSALNNINSAMKQTSLRVLEIGEGIIGTFNHTLSVLQNLPASTYVEYVIADANQKVLDELKEFTKEYSWVTLLKLDVNESIDLSNRTVSDGFDIVIASSLPGRFIPAIHSLMEENGLLIANELSLSFRHLPLLINSDVQSLSELTHAVENAGLKDVVPYKLNGSYSSVVIATKINEKNDTRILVIGDQIDAIHSIERSLVKVSDVNNIRRDYEVALLSPEPNVYVVYIDTTVPEQEELAIEAMEQKIFDLTKVLSSVTPTSQKKIAVYVITKGASLSSSEFNLNASSYVGCIRSAQSELKNIPLYHYDVALTANLSALQGQILRELLNSRRNQSEEVHFNGNSRSVIRYQSTPTSDEAEFQTIDVTSNDNETNFKLEIPEDRSLKGLFFNEVERTAPESNEVEVQISYLGLNFKDLMKIQALDPIEANVQTEDFALKFAQYCSTIGMEATGKVTRVGQSVKDQYSIGDFVIIMAAPNQSIFSPFLNVQAEYCYNIKKLFGETVAKTVSDIEFASSCVAMMTAYYSLVERAGLKKGQTVLIHSAAGTVGIAAIEICHWVGATVYATASNNQKKEYLKNKMLVEEVFDSRSTKFEYEILRHTKGRGVDVVLNSLYDELFDASVNVLAKGGAFVEIGKRDIFSHKTLDIFAFRSNAQFHTIDLSILEPEDWKRLGGAVFFSFGLQMDNGLIFGRNIPFNVFEVGETIQAFELLQSGTHIGKIIIKFNDRKLSVPVQRKKFKLIPNRTGTYLITGGIGGLGLGICKYLIAEHKVKNIVLLSRRQAPEDIQLKINSLMNTTGANILVSICDVVDQKQVIKVVKDIESDGVLHPLKGVFHCAVVLDDCPMMALTQEKIQRVMRPKIIGAYNLHVATNDLSLDHFVMMSSISNIYGLNAQTNYNAGNSYLEAIAEYRRRKGLSGVSLSLPPISGVGILEKDSKSKQIISANNFTIVPVEDVFNIMSQIPSLSQHSSNVVIMPAVTSKDVYIPARLSNLKVHYILENSCSSDLAQFDFEEVLEALKVNVAKISSNDAGTLNITVPLNDLGFDSLKTVELFNIIDKTFKTKIATSVLQTSSVKDLAMRITKNSNNTSSEFVDISGASSSSKSTTTKRLIPLRKSVFNESETVARLIIFPFLGGSAEHFALWANHLPKNIELYILDYSLANAGTIGPLRIPSWSLLMELLLVELSPLLCDTQKPCIFYGHSIGATIAFEFIRFLQTRNHKLPLFVTIGAQLPWKKDNTAVGLFNEIISSKSEDIAIQKSKELMSLNIFPDGNLWSESDILDDKEKALRMITFLNIPVIRSQFDFMNYYDCNDNLDVYGLSKVAIPLLGFWSEADLEDYEDKKRVVNQWTNYSTQLFKSTGFQAPHVFVNIESCVKEIISQICDKYDSVIANQNLGLENVEKTLLVPLIARAMETLSEKPRFRDEFAVEIFSKHSDDYIVHLVTADSASRRFCIARTIALDTASFQFVTKNTTSNNGVVIVNLGCGLCTRYNRLFKDNKNVTWYDLDLPNVIALRQKYFHPNERYRMASASVTDPTWTDHIKIPSQDTPVLVIAEGLFYYFEDSEVKAILSNIADKFPGSEILAEFPSIFLQYINKLLKPTSIEDMGSSFKMGLFEPIDTLWRWDPRLELKEEIHPFERYEYSFNGPIGVFPEWLPIFGGNRKSQKILHISVKSTPIARQPVHKRVWNYSRDLVQFILLMYLCSLFVSPLLLPVVAILIQHVSNIVFEKAKYNSKKLLNVPGPHSIPLIGHAYELNVQGPEKIRDMCKPYLTGIIKLHTLDTPVYIAQSQVYEEQLVSKSSNVFLSVLNEYGVTSSHANIDISSQIPNLIKKGEEQSINLLNHLANKLNKDQSGEIEMNGLCDTFIYNTVFQWLFSTDIYTYDGTISGSGKYVTQLHQLSTVLVQLRDTLLGQSQFDLLKKKIGVSKQKPKIEQIINKYKSILDTLFKERSGTKYHDAIEYIVREKKISNKDFAATVAAAVTPLHTTLVRSLMLAISYLAIHPEIQAILREETRSSNNDLPLLSAFIYQVFGSNPLGSYEIPRVNQHEIEINKMFIPKNSLIITNPCWATASQAKHQGINFKQLSPLSTQQYNKIFGTDSSRNPAPLLIQLFLAKLIANYQIETIEQNVHHVCDTVFITPTITKLKLTKLE
jgi:phthiocerol/phenolphthiocerol synthesis type-I polyketide synthase C